MRHLELDIFGLTVDEQDEQGYPLLDLLETASEIVIEADLPGVAVEDISLQYLEGTLLIEARKRENPEKNRVRYLCLERVFDRFRRIIRIPIPVNAGSSHACLHNGVLTISFSKVSEKRGRPIPIKIEQGTRSQK